MEKEVFNERRKADSLRSHQQSDVRTKRRRKAPYRAGVFSGRDPGDDHLLEEKIFRYDVSREGSVSEYAAPRDEAHTAKIQQRPDSSDAYMKPESEVTEDPVSVCIRCKETCIVFEKETGRMTIYVGKRKILEEAKPLEFTGDETIQTLARHEKEQFYGGGTQNGRFVHTGKKFRLSMRAPGWTEE